jgi:hypothetical protein
MTQTLVRNYRSKTKNQAAASNRQSSKDDKQGQAINFFSAADHAEHGRSFIALIGIDKTTIEPFFKSCQPEKLSGLQSFNG